MTLRKSHFVLFVFALVVTGAVALVAACSGQGEGERCSVLSDNNGDDDCAGLHCTPAGQLNGSSTDRCCPADRTQATTPVCAVQTAVGIEAGQLPTEGGTGDTGANDGASDAANDSSGDAGATDGAADAAADG
jgi:hypothetical protein